MAVKKKAVKKVAKTKKKVVKKTAKKGAKKTVKKTAKKKVVKKKAAKKVASKPAKKTAPAKKVAPKKKVEVKKATVTKSRDTKKIVKEVIEVIKPIAQNDFINLKMAKSHHENPREHAHEEQKPHDEVEHAPLTPFVREEPKVGRNDPCPCGSGNKYKKCCGKND